MTATTASLRAIVCFATPAALPVRIPSVRVRVAGSFFRNSSTVRALAKGRDRSGDGSCAATKFPIRPRLCELTAISVVS